MALPTRPIKTDDSVKSNRTVKKDNLPPQSSLPPISSDALPKKSSPKESSLPRQSAQNTESFDRAPSERPTPRKRKLQNVKPVERVSKESTLVDDSDVPEGWARDKKTGRLYKKIPKAAFDGDQPILQLTDLDLDNLNGEADKYLAHLRVPPDREERKKLMEERKARATVQNKEYYEMNKED